MARKTAKTESTTKDTDEIKQDADKTPRASALRNELLQEKERLEKQLAPAREFYEKHVNDPKFLETRKTIKETSAELAVVLNELAALIRPTARASMKAEPGEYTKE